MKFFFALALLVAAAAAAPPTDDKNAEVIQYSSNNIGVEGYDYSVESSNGIKSQEQGKLKNVGSENEAMEVRGQYSYPGPDGVIYTVTYLADENGFQPSAAHLPQA